MKEVWKDVVGYEGLYEVSDLGNVRVSRVGSPFFMKCKSIQRTTKDI